MTWNPLGTFVMVTFILTDNWQLNMQLLEEGEVVEDHSGPAQFTNTLTDQVRNVAFQMTCGKRDLYEELVMFRSI